MGRRTTLVLMGQTIAKHEMNTGVRLYHRQRHRQAVIRWQKALKRLGCSSDRFVTLGYLAQAHCESGDFDEMLRLALMQMELANRMSDGHMKAEAYLNLARVHERLADFSKAIQYGRSCLLHRSSDSTIAGHALLVIGKAHLGFSQFQATLEAFEKAMQIATDTTDRLLELQLCIGLGGLFTHLMDLTKALLFLRNAMTILQNVRLVDVHYKYKSAILYRMAIALQKSGSIVDAKEACEESLRLSSEFGNRPIQARSLAALADVHSELGEYEKSLSGFNSAYEIVHEINDFMGQVIILGSMAKSVSEGRRHDSGQCECQAIQINKKCLEIAKRIGCKHSMLNCHLRLETLYRELCDEDSEELARKAVTCLVQEMELFCNFCGQRYGFHNEALQALRCSHIFHERCLRTQLSDKENKTCAKCQCKAILMKNMATVGVDESDDTRAKSRHKSIRSTVEIATSSGRIVGDLVVEDAVETRREAQKPGPYCSKDEFRVPGAVSNTSEPLVISRSSTVTDV